MVQLAPGGTGPLHKCSLKREVRLKDGGVSFSLPHLCPQLPCSTPVTHPDPAVPVLAGTRGPLCSSSGQHCPAHLAIRDRISLMRTTSFSCCSGLLSMALCSFAM